MRLEIEVSIGLGQLPIHIGGEVLVMVAGDEYI